MKFTTIIKNNKLKAVLIATTCGALIGAPAITVPILNSISVQKLAATNNGYYYLYNDQYFDSLDEATQDVVIKNKPISNNIYVGDINDAIFDQESKRLDVSKLRQYDSGKMAPAFQNAIGQYTHDYKAARNSFVNKGLINYLYDDFNGNIYDNEIEAIRAMRDATFKTPLAYHELNFAYDKNENANFAINPLNKDDIEVFKSKVIDDFDKEENLNVKVYDLVGNPLTDDPTDLAYASVTTDFLNKNEDYIQGFSEFLAKKYLDVKRNFFTETIRWNVSVYPIVSHQDVNYGFDGANFEKVDELSEINAWSDGTNLFYDNVKYSELSEFNTWLNRAEFANKHWTSILYNPVGWDVCELAGTKNGVLGMSYSLGYRGMNWGTKPGIDVQILQPGTCEGFELSFGVDFKIRDVAAMQNQFNNVIQDTFNTDIIRDYQNSRSLDFSNQTIEETFSYNLLKMIKDNLINRTWEKDKNSIFNANRSVYKDKKTINNRVYTALNNDNMNDILWDINDSLSNFWSFPNGEVINFSDFFKNPMLNELKNTNFALWTNTLKYMIEFNGHPLFEIPNKIIENSSSIDGLFINKSSNTPKTLTKLTFSKFMNSINTDELKKGLINVSSKQKVIEEITGETSRYNSYLPYDWNRKEYAYNKYEQDEDGYFKYINGEPIPPHIANKRFDYNIDTAFYSYNKALKNIYDTQKVLPETTRKLMIKPEEVLTIYNAGDSQFELCYSEYLTSSSSFNSPLLNQNNITLFNNEAEIIAAIEISKMLEPAKIIVIYDVLGNIINAGVRLSSDDKLSTTNDAVYDAQNSVIDNILRTKVIRNDPSKTFYLETDGTYTLLKNTKDVIYKLDWEKKAYYFPTFQDAWNYVYEFIKTEAIRIAK